MMWVETFHTCERVRNSMDTMGSTTSLFKNSYGENPNIIGFVLGVQTHRIRHQMEKFKKEMMDKTFKPIMVGYADNHTRDTYKLYNLETNRVIMTRDIK